MPFFQFSRNATYLTFVFKYCWTLCSRLQFKVELRAKPAKLQFLDGVADSPNVPIQTALAEKMKHRSVFAA